MGKDLPAGLDNFVGLVQVSEHDVGFDLRVGVGYSVSFLVLLIRGTGRRSAPMDPEN